MSEFIFRPSDFADAPEKVFTRGIKFSQNIHIMKDFLDQKGIPYKEEELEMTPIGLAMVIKEGCKNDHN